MDQQTTHQPEELLTPQGEPAREEEDLLRLENDMNAPVQEDSSRNSSQSEPEQDPDQLEEEQHAI